MGPATDPTDVTMPAEEPASVSDPPVVSWAPRRPEAAPNDAGHRRCRRDRISALSRGASAVETEAMVEARPPAVGVSRESLAAAPRFTEHRPARPLSVTLPPNSRRRTRRTLTAERATVGRPTTGGHTRHRRVCRAPTAARPDRAATPLDETRSPQGSARRIRIRPDAGTRSPAWSQRQEWSDYGDPSASRQSGSSGRCGVRRRVNAAN